VIDGKQAVQNVRAAHQAFIDNVTAMNKCRTPGAEYEALKAADKPLWDKFRAAKDDLCDHVYETYGVSLFDLKNLGHG
jgi:hypothetical protein